MCGTKSLKPIAYDAPMASAQLKTASLLAGVYANGTTTVNEPSESRNHTELMLPEYGVKTTAAARPASVVGPSVPAAAAVSYTHLDVYKRQAIRCSIAEPPYMPTEAGPASSPARRQWTGSVSYTHLDVYKRQALRHRAKTLSLR